MSLSITWAKALLEDCEWQETRLKGCISVEYKMMKVGYYEVHSLLIEAERIAEGALQMLEYASKNSLAPAIYPQLGESLVGDARNT